VKRIAINGLGRIGRMFLRLAFGGKDIEIVALNDTRLEAKALAYFLKYDSVYGRYSKNVTPNKGGIEIDGVFIPLLAEGEPDKLPWKEKSIDLVVEATGIFLSYDGKKGASRHLSAGAKQVLLSVPPKGDGAEKIPQIVYGVNEEIYDPKVHRIVSAASCTTNSLAPVAYVLEQEYGIVHAFLTTVHAYTSGQAIVDSASSKLTRGRAAAVNIVPTTTGAATATTKVIPALTGKMDGIALRVPVPTGAASDFVAEMKQEVSADEVNDVFRRYADGKLVGVLGISDDPLVSSDIIGDPRASIVDLSCTRVVDRTLLKVVTFYDNEWGYTNQLLRVATLL